jgi:DNA-binding transcriptional regulator YiaG
MTSTSSVAGLREAGCSLIEFAVAPELQDATAPGAVRCRFVPDPAGIVLALTLMVGSGGFFRSEAAEALDMSGGQTLVDVRGSAHPGGAKDSQTVEASYEAVSAPERIEGIRASLSLSVTGVAQALRVGRPAVYAWMRGAAVPRAARQLRLKALYDVACEWRSLSPNSVGKHLIAPLADGASLLSLLAAKRLDRAAVTRALEQLSTAIRVAEQRRMRSEYRSAASVMRTEGIRPASRPLQQDRIDEASDLS